MAVHEIRRYDDDFRVWHSAYTNMSFLAHWHEEIELIWVRSGTAVITIESKTYFADEGDLLLCGSGCIHYCDSPDMKNRLEFLLFDPALIQSRLSPLHIGSPYIAHQQLQEVGMQDEVIRLFRDLPDELAMKSAHYREVIRGMLRIFWYKCERFFVHQEKQADMELSGDEQSIQQVLQYLDTHYSEELSLSQAARQVNVSECYLSRCFKRYTGMNFVTYRNLLRLEKAIDLLQQTAEPMGSVAFNCGFQDIRTFNRVFRQYTSHTPSEFRRNSQLGAHVVARPHRQDGNQLLVENLSPVVKQNLEI